MWLYEHTNLKCSNSAKNRRIRNIHQPNVEPSLLKTQKFLQILFQSVFAFLSLRYVQVCFNRYNSLALDFLGKLIRIRRRQICAYRYAMSSRQRLRKLYKAGIQERFASRHINSPYFPRLIKSLCDMLGRVLSTRGVFCLPVLVRQIPKTVCTIEITAPVHPPMHPTLKLCLNFLRLRLFRFYHFSVSFSRPHRPFILQFPILTGISPPAR